MKISILNASSALLLLTCFPLASRASDTVLHSCSGNPSPVALLADPFSLQPTITSQNPVSNLMGMHWEISGVFDENTRVPVLPHCLLPSPACGGIDENPPEPGGFPEHSDEVPPHPVDTPAAPTSTNTPISSLNGTFYEQQGWLCEERGWALDTINQNYNYTHVLSTALGPKTVSKRHFEDQYYDASGLRDLYAFTTEQISENVLQVPLQGHAQAQLPGRIVLGTEATEKKKIIWSQLENNLRRRYQAIFEKKVSTQQDKDSGVLLASNESIDESLLALDGPIVHLIEYTSTISKKFDKDGPIQQTQDVAIGHDNNQTRYFFTEVVIWNRPGRFIETLRLSVTEGVGLVDQVIANVEFTWNADGDLLKLVIREIAQTLPLSDDIRRIAIDEFNNGQLAKGSFLSDAPSLVHIDEQTLKRQ